MSNIGRAIPSLGMLGIVFPLTTALLQRSGHGFLPGLIALVALAIPPDRDQHLRRDCGTWTRDLQEAGRGMGMRELQLLRRVELPLALPVILAGIRIIGGGDHGHRHAGAHRRRRTRWAPTSWPGSPQRRGPRSSPPRCWSSSWR